jgi:hypothetical protein
MRPPLLPLLLLAALLLAGCGAGATVRLNDRRVAFTLDEYRILPRTVSVPPGRIRIVVSNRGILTHNLFLELENDDSEGNPVILARTPTLMPGASTSQLTPPLRAGRYKLLSTIANQADLGMSGTLIVR